MIKTQITSTGMFTNITGPIYVQLVSRPGLVGAPGAPGTPSIFLDVATQADAEAGTDNTKGMTPLRVVQSIEVNETDHSDVLLDGDLASQGEGEAGTDNVKWMSPLRVFQAIVAKGSTIFQGISTALSKITESGGLPRWDGGDWPAAAGSEVIDWANPISITGTDTLTIGKHHVCSGTFANYTANLPPVAGNAGKLLSVEMAPTLTKRVTLDGDGSEKIDTKLTRVMWAKETAILLCDGVKWTKESGKFQPFEYSGERTTAVEVLDGVATFIPINSLFCLSLPVLDAGGFFKVPRNGMYIISGMISYDGTVGSTGSDANCAFGLNGTTTFPTSPPMIANIPTAGNSGVFIVAHPSLSVTRELLKDDTISLLAFQTSGGTMNTRTPATVRPNLVIRELQTW